MKLLIDSCVFIDTFDPESTNYEASLKLLDYLRRADILITMPAHGWFEVQCTFQRLSMQKRFVGPKLQNPMGYPIELMHIDAEFISKYSMVDIAYIKASDHIFIAVAKVNDWPLVTSDIKMTKVANNAGVAVFNPEEYMLQLGANA